MAQANEQNLEPVSYTHLDVYKRQLIALWLGHESVETTQIYLDANLAIKQAVLDKTTPP